VRRIEVQVQANESVGINQPSPGLLRGIKRCFLFSSGPNAVRPLPTLELKNKKQRLTPRSAPAQEEGKVWIG
jgi:hypothetical protein